MVERSVEVDVGGIKWDVIVDILAFEDKPNILKSVTNQGTGKVFLKSSPTFRWIEAELRLVAMDQDYQQIIAAKNEEIIRSANSARADATNRALLDNQLIFNTLRYRWLPNKIDIKPRYRDYSNQDILALWGIEINLPYGPNEALRNARLPENWSLVLRVVPWLEVIHHPMLVCIQDERGQIRGYFDPTSKFDSQLYLTSAVKIEAWSNEEGNDGVDVYFLDQPKKKWGEFFYHRETEKSHTIPKMATTFADTNYPLRHDPQAYW